MAPVVTATTGAVYDRLPEHYRAADAAQVSPDVPLLRYLSLTADQLHTVAVLLDRLGHDDGGAWASDLADPVAADTAWLAWLAQLVGIDPADQPSPAALRLAIAEAAFDAGTLGSLRRVLEAYVADPKRYIIVKHPAGDPWVVVVVVHPDDVTLTWSALEANFGSWNDIDAAGSWDGLGDDGAGPLAAALERVRPAGVRFDLTLGANTWDGIDSLGSWDAVEALGDWDAVENGGW